jgi:hypothetical protein
MRTRFASLALLAAAAFPFLMIPACGGGTPQPETPPTPSASASASETSAAPTPSASDTTAATPPAASSAATPPEPPAQAEQKSKKADKKVVGSEWADCHKDVKSTANHTADVAKLGKACEKATKMKAMGKVLTGSQDAEGKPQQFPLKAEAGKCYRVYAAADKGITDLDIAIKDSNGDIAGDDSTDDPTPVVLEDGAVCFKEADAATVIVSVGGGKGKYALQVWSD